MKKRNLKSLQLNKKSISTLNKKTVNKIHGGVLWSLFWCREKKPAPVSSPGNDATCQGLNTCVYLDGC
ncbi:class I lanthipeptide [uncultured Kordia sp.]|uniref:class I lanthipeptide n=1 Tax=uncultured Kordia sp. TaxID=507699 RepID=UPI00262217CA|nr:class I lanthipeptide [uncultured Kordia sp.]